MVTGTVLLPLITMTDAGLSSQQCQSTEGNWKHWF